MLRALWIRSGDDLCYAMSTRNINLRKILFWVQTQTHFDSLVGGNKEYKRGKIIQDTFKHNIQIYESTHTYMRVKNGDFILYNALCTFWLGGYRVELCVQTILALHLI